MRIQKYFCGVLLSVVLVGCQSAATRAPKAPLLTPDAYFAKLDLSAAELKSHLIGKTVRFYDPGHGTQVAYYSASGKEYLWYPKNRRVVTGNWEIRPSHIRDVAGMTTEGRKRRRVKNSDVCFQYGNNTYNPVTGKSGGRWQCTPSVFWLRNLDERTEGDVFNLSSGEVPFPLNRAKTSIAELLSKCTSCR